MGRPIVATAVGGVPELIRDGANGLTVPADDPKALAQGIGRLLADPAFAGKMAARARTDAGVYDMSEHVRRLEELYQEVAGTREGSVR